jgi:cell division topological specificity factor
MKKLFLLIALALPFAALVFIVEAATQPGTPRGASRLTIEQLIDIRHPSSPVWSPDGRHVAYVVDNERSESQTITHGNDSDVYVAASDGTARIVEDLGQRGLLGQQPDLLSKLREEILAAVSRHVALDPDRVIVRMDRGKNVSTLEVDIELPNGLEPALAAAG